MSIQHGLRCGVLLGSLLLTGSAFAQPPAAGAEDIPAPATAPAAVRPGAPPKLVYQKNGKTAWLDDAGRLYYFDGRRWACQLPNGTVFVQLVNKNWVPLGALDWTGPSDPAALPQSRLWVPSRYNIGSAEYRRVYGQDLWWTYGPGHFLD